MATQVPNAKYRPTSLQYSIALVSIVRTVKLQPCVMFCSQYSGGINGKC